MQTHETARLTANKLKSGGGGAAVLVLWRLAVHLDNVVT